ncbi:MAG: glycoside hydrolase family 5 protein [Sedimentisphaerales bacterium]
MNVKLVVSILLTAAVLAGCSTPPEKSQSGMQVKSTSPPLALKVKGNQVLNSKEQPVLLRGVNTASLEWSSDGEGHILETVRVAIDDWNCNIIRLPLTQDRWFGKAPEQKDEGKAYRALVKKVVDLCSSKGCYIILDLHWSDVNEWGQNINQHSMPDRNSIIFWKDFASVYANNPAVIFDLYNEPHDVTWDVWLKGGEINDRPNGPDLPVKEYEAVGMQEMLDAVRSTGAKNVVIAGGLAFAYDFDGILEGRQLKDPTGNGVIYANHAYDYFGESIFTWIASMKEASVKFPVIVSEFGWSGGPNRRKEWWGNNPSAALNDDWLLHLLQGIYDNNWSFTAWDMHPAAGPTLIAGWNYMPTPDFGVYVKQLLITGKSPGYTPPDLSKIAETPVSTLPESARMGASELYGDWLMKADPCGGQGNAILYFGADSAGKLTGQWINSKQLTELGDVRFKDGAITFCQPAQSRKEIINGYFTGTIEGSRISGTVTCNGNKSHIEGRRILKTNANAIPVEANSPGSQLIGNWILNSKVKWGSPEQRLKVNPDMSGLYGVTPINKITLDGDKVSFKVSAGKYPIVFDCKLDGAKLAGVQKTSRDTQEVTGEKID